MADDQRETRPADRHGYDVLFRRAELAGGTGSFVLDLRSNAWQWGSCTAVLFGFDPETPQPTVAEWERSIFVDDVPKLHAAIDAAVETGVYYTEFRVRRPDDRVHWIAGKGETAKDEKGHARWLCGSYYDITDRKGLEARLLALNETLETRVVAVREEARTLELLNQRASALASELGLELAARRDAEQALQHLNETLEERVAEEIEKRRGVEDTLRQAQKMESIGQLTGGIAHDFNNLLTVIYGNVETLQRQLAPEDMGQRAVAAALRGASRAALLTQRLLAFSRRQPLAPQPLSVNRLVAGMSDLLRRTLGETINIETVLAGGLWPSFADLNQLENAVLNLAVNARDAMPDGGKLTVETANCHLDFAYARLHADVQPGQYVGIFITDTGIGMAEDIVAKAFEPFFTTKGPGEGTGLGLSQVYGFLKQSDGHVKIYSEVGQGTSIKLYLPRYLGPDAPAEEAAEAGPTPRSKAGETVLVVEDDPDVRSYTTSMVADLGYAVLAAEDGATALRLLDAHRDVQLLFTDVGLPRGMNGRQLAEEALRRRPSLKVLFTTGYARNAIVHHGRLDAGVDVLLKPFTYTDLAAMLRRVLDR